MDFLTEGVNPDKVLRLPWQEKLKMFIASKPHQNKKVQQAITRFLSDIQRDDLSYNEDQVDRVCTFFEKGLKLYKGGFKGQPFLLMPHQVFILANLFGLLKESDGKRKYTQAYCEMARKGGKSTLAGGIAIYMFVADGEGAPEVYSAATTRDQAKIVFSSARAMIAASPGLTSQTILRQHHVDLRNDEGQFSPISGESKTLDGKDPHCAIIDELHAHDDRLVYELLLTAIGARQQPLLFSITTAGQSRESICAEVKDYCEEILRGTAKGDNIFAFICTIDEEDDWTDEKVWHKANPGMPYGAPRLEQLRQGYEQAQNSLSAKSSFRRLHLNEWLSNVTGWVSRDDWDKCGGRDQIPEGGLMYVGLDLASKHDVAALVGLMPRDGKLYVKTKFYLPKHKIEEKEKRDKVPYREWAEAGYLTLTPGVLTDYEYILTDLEDWGAQYWVPEVGFDSWGFSQIHKRLDDVTGDNCIGIRSGYASLSAPTKDIESQLLAENIIHDDNPLMSWMIGNVSVEHSPREDIKVSKKVSTGRIDGVDALVNAMYLYQENGEMSSPGIVLL